jgi:hypothetical protein
MQIGINDQIFAGKGPDEHINASACAALSPKLKGINHSVGVVGFNTTVEHGAYW